MGVFGERDLVVSTVVNGSYDKNGYFYGDVVIEKIEMHDGVKRVVDLTWLIDSIKVRNRLTNLCEVEYESEMAGNSARKGEPEYAAIGE